jgi:hypothetical protein
MVLCEASRELDPVPAGGSARSMSNVFQTPPLTSMTRADPTLSSSQVMRTRARPPVPCSVQDSCERPASEASPARGWPNRIADVTTDVEQCRREDLTEGNRSDVFRAVNDPPIVSVDLTIKKLGSRIRGWPQPRNPGSEPFRCVTSSAWQRARGTWTACTGQATSRISSRSRRSVIV